MDAQTIVIIMVANNDGPFISMYGICNTGSIIPITNETILVTVRKMTLIATIETKITKRYLLNGEQTLYKKAIPKILNVMTLIATAHSLE